MQNSLAHMSMPHHRDFAFDVPKDISKLGIPTANGARQRWTSTCCSDADLRALWLSAVCMGDGVLSLTSRLALLFVDVVEKHAHLCALKWPEKDLSCKPTPAARLIRMQR